jgi:hypothetical protein
MNNFVKPVVFDVVSETDKVISMVDEMLILHCDGMPVENGIEQE